MSASAFACLWPINANGVARLRCLRKIFLYLSVMARPNNTTAKPERKMGLHVARTRVNVLLLPVFREMPAIIAGQLFYKVGSFGASVPRREHRQSLQGVSTGDLITRSPMLYRKPCASANHNCKRCFPASEGSKREGDCGRELERVTLLQWRTSFTHCYSDLSYSDLASCIF